MSLTRRTFLASAAAATMAGSLRGEAKKTDLGLLLYSYSIRARGDRDFADPLAFLSFCHERGAAGVQLPLGRREEDDSKKVKKRAGELGLYVEGIVRAPTEKKDVERFTAEIRTAKSCGADVLRTVMLGGPRYEQFDKADDYVKFA